MIIYMVHLWCLFSRNKYRKQILSASYSSCFPSISFRSRCNISKLQKYIATTRWRPVSYKPERLSYPEKNGEKAREEIKKERQIEISNLDRAKQYELVDIEKQIESERCRKRWISVCTCIALPQILSTNSLPTLLQPYVHYGALSIFPDVRRDSRCGENFRILLQRNCTLREREINMPNDIEIKLEYF